MSNTRTTRTTGITRRAALGLAAGSATAGLLAACTSDHPHGLHTATTPPPTGGGGHTPAVTGSPTITPSSPATPDWAGLAGRLDGRLLRPGDGGYAAAARVYNPRFDASAHPAAVAVCASDRDVAQAVRFAADARVPFALRSGGHSYPGWSTGPGLVIDVSGLGTVAVDRAAGTARIGAGTQMATVYAALAAHGVGIAAGSCATVGIAGLTLGGGVGVLTRAWGLTCDAVRELDVVTADGTLRHVDATHDPDLFWALRGGGGGSFGAVTSLTLATHPAPTVSTFYLAWSWSHAAAVLDAWQHFMAGADARMQTTCKLLSDRYNGTRRALVAGTWIGPAAELSGRLAPLRAALPPPTSTSIHAHDYADAMLLEAGCSGQSPRACLAQAMTPARRQPFSATSSIVASTLPAAAIEAAVAHAAAASGVPGLYEGGVSFDALGGAVANVAPTATAFPWRAAMATAQYTATWADLSHAAAIDAYVRGFRSAMASWFGTAAYVNYADASITDYGNAYWGPNHPRLQAVKHTYDPGGLFTFPQAVTAGS